MFRVYCINMYFVSEFYQDPFLVIEESYIINLDGYTFEK